VPPRLCSNPTNSPRAARDALAAVRLLGAELLAQDELPLQIVVALQAGTVIYGIWAPLTGSTSP